MADSSVWIAHFRKTERHLAGLLEASVVLMHPFIIGELACGNLPNRPEVLLLLRSLPRAVVADPGEVLSFIESGNLWGLGVGLVDINLIASSLLSYCKLWTFDNRLATAAKSAGVSLFESPGHLTPQT